MNIKAKLQSVQQLGSRWILLRSNLLKLLPEMSKLSEKHGPKVEDQPALPRSAMKCISRQRSFISYANFKRSPWWDELGCGLSDADGIIRLNHIDTDSTTHDLFAQFHQFLKPADELPEQMRWEECPSVHHTTCPIGQCARSHLASLASPFVASMSRLLQDGA